MLLALDTSTMQTGVAFFNEQGLLAECNWHSGRQHTTQLLPIVDQLLHHLGTTVTALSAVAVALGPGSWSGLRVGLSTAKGLAMARGLPIVGVSTLDVLARQHQRAGHRVQPVIELGRDRYATAIYDSVASHPVPVVVETAALLTPPAEPTVYCGDIARIHDALALLPGAILPNPDEHLRRAGVLAAIGWQRVQQGNTDTLATLEPIYLGQAVRQRTT